MNRMRAFIYLDVVLFMFIVPFAFYRLFIYLLPLEIHSFVHIPSLDMDFQRRMSWYFYIHWVQLKRDMIICFVDIGKIDDHHCLTFTLFWNIKFICTRNGVLKDPPQAWHVYLFLSLIRMHLIFRDMLCILYTPTDKNILFKEVAKTITF